MPGEPDSTTTPAGTPMPKRYPPGERSGVVCAGRHDLPAVIALAAGTDAWLPWAAWMAPGSEDRAGILRAGYTILAEVALGHGFVDLIADRAAAIWLDRTVALPAPSGPARRRLRAACGPLFDVALPLLDLAAAHRPGYAHLHLAALAAPRADDAALLLAHRHHRLDRTGVAAYAEAGSDAQLAVLVAAGYRPGDTFQLTAGPPIQPLLRTPACGGAGRGGTAGRILPPDIG